MIDRNELHMLTNLNEVLVAITHWDRFQIVNTILENEPCSFKIIEKSINHHAPRREATRHLRFLYQFKIVSRTKVGRETYYTVNKDVLQMLKYMAKRFSKLETI